jgi:hypothetical protein
VTQEMVIGVFSILPEWSLTPVGNFMDMFKDSQTVPLHEEGHARPPVEVPMHSPVMPSTEKHIHILEWHILQPGALYPDPEGDTNLQGGPCKTWSCTTPKTLPYIVCGLDFTIGAGASMQLMPDLNAWKENHML